MGSHAIPRISTFGDTIRGTIWLRPGGRLPKFGAPPENDGITAHTFTGAQVVYQIGIAPVRIDILTEITGVEFTDAWTKRVGSTFFGVPVHFISLDDLIANKRALARQ